MSFDYWDRSTSGHRIHVFGASGAGTSTLGRALATDLASQHFDTDDFFWYPTDPPFTAKRSPEDRRALMECVFVPRRDWVLSGSMDGWAGPIAQQFTLAVRLTLDPGLRRARLEARELRRCGCRRAWGQPLCQRCIGFLSWADGYESGNRPGRSLERHKTWAQTLPCPVLVLDSARPVPELVSAVLERLDHSATLA